jgi:hypothetical protein
VLQSRRAFLSTTAAILAASGCDAPTSHTSTANDIDPQTESSEPMPKLTANGAKLDHPLLQRLHGLDRHIREKMSLPAYADPGVGCVGLILYSTLEHGTYSCSPRNALTFAHTGGDGDHYSLLIKDGIVDESSPVIMTWPSEGSHAIVGESLHDFLCFGLHGGCFQILSDIRNTPSVEANGQLFHPHVEEHEQQVLSLLAKDLELKPWPLGDQVSKYKALQERFGQLVDAPEEME